MKLDTRAKVEEPVVKLQMLSHQPILPKRQATSELLNRFKVEEEVVCQLPACDTIEEAAQLYCQEYTKLFQENQELNNKLIEVIELRNSLAQRYNSYKRARCGQEYVKRKRREAKDIERTYFCPIDRCNKGYGSEGSLTHHMRLKHREYYDSGKYEVFLQEYNDKLKKQKNGPTQGKKKSKMRDSKVTTWLQIKDTPEIKIEGVRQCDDDS